MSLVPYQTLPWVGFPSNAGEARPHLLLQVSKDGYPSSGAEHLNELSPLVELTEEEVEKALQ